jgi:hypothetical protein
MTAPGPVALALLRHLAATRGPDDPVGSMARGVLSGRAGLRESVTCSWHGEALTAAYAAARSEQERMTPAERAAYDGQAAALRLRIIDFRAAGGSRRASPQPE